VHEATVIVVGAFSFVVEEDVDFGDVQGAELAGLEGGGPVVGEGELPEAVDGVGVGGGDD